MVPVPFRDPRACALATHSSCAHPVVSKVEGSGLRCLESPQIFHIHPSCPHCRRASKGGLGGGLTGQARGLGAWPSCARGPAEPACLAPQKHPVLSQAMAFVPEHVHSLRFVHSLGRWL